MLLCGTTECGWTAGGIGLPFYFTVNVIKTGMWSCFVCDEVYKGLIRIHEGKETT